MGKYLDLYSVDSTNSVSKLNNDSMDNLSAPHLNEDIKTRNEADVRAYRQLKTSNKELLALQKDILVEHQELSEKVARMSDNLKKMKYEDAMESKANITTNRLNR